MLFILPVRRSVARLLLAVPFALAIAAPAQADPYFEIYGFAQLDYIQDFKRVNPDWEATLRPSKIPVESGEYGSDGQAILSVRQTKLGVKASIPVDGSDLYTQVDFDFFGTGSDAGQTTIRLRNAYGRWKEVLAGQTATLFMDGSIFPNVIDYWGPDGMVYLLNPQIRWTPLSGPNSFAIAIEQPSNDIDTGTAREIDPAIADNVQDDSKVPDLTAQFRAERDWGHVQLAGILRRLGYDTAGTPNNEPKGHETGWGLNLTGSVKSVGDDKLNLGVVYGHGIASYMNDGGVDLAPKCELDLNGDCVAGTVQAKSVPLLGVMAYYDHYWSSRYSTSFGYAQTRVDNENGQEGNAYEAGQYASVNLIFTPDSRFMAGAELLWGSLEDKASQNGSDVRLQFSVKYKFTSKDFLKVN